MPHTCLPVHTQVNAHILSHTCTHAYACICTHMHTHAHTHAHRAHTCTRMYTHTHKVHVCVQMCTHTLTSTCTHTPCVTWGLSVSQGGGSYQPDTHKPLLTPSLLQTPGPELALLTQIEMKITKIGTRQRRRPRYTTEKLDQGVSDEK